MRALWWFVWFIVASGVVVTALGIPFVVVMRWLWRAGSKRS